MAERLVDAPESLRVRVIGAFGRTDEGAVRGAVRHPPLSRQASPHNALADLHSAASTLLAEARSGAPTRTTALTLLAADALVTLAVEAEFDVEDIGGP